ncbi:MAG: hypothetical protein H6737_24365 [Alphaproteobacteria bacterium]|nr:hypothetical protein [Alphaproteobacteria bacterium]
MSCATHAIVVDCWNPAGADLPDATALHLDECPACRARFDARFAPAAVERTESPRRAPTGLLAVAVALLVASVVPGSLETRAVASVDLGECVDEIAVEALFDPVCEEV